MKWIAAAAALFCVSSTFASYELALILDADNKIHRFDAENGVYLGRINTTIEAYDIAANQATGEVSVLGRDSSGSATIERINFHTGRRIASFKLTGFTYNLFLNNSFSQDSAGNFLVSGVDSGSLYGGGQGIFRFSPSGAFLGPLIRWNATDFQYGFSHQMSNGAIYAMSNTNTVSWTNRIMGFNPANNSYVGNYVVGSDFFETSSYLWGGAGSGDRMVFGEFNALDAQYTIHSLVRSGGNLVSSATRTFATSSLAFGNLTDGALPMFEFGHGTYGYMFGDRLVGSSYRPVITPTNLQTLTYDANNQYIVSQASGLRATAMVIAPEPGTMTALALGAAAFLRRRKK